MLKYFSDKLLVFLINKFGYPDESLQKEEEIIKLKKALIEEKLKSSENMQMELIELRSKVEQLNEEKIFMLEQEIQRLRYENHQIKQNQQLPKSIPNQSSKMNLLGVNIYEKMDSK